jgi:hypothetical protein
VYKSQQNVAMDKHFILLFHMQTFAWNGIQHLGRT